MRPVSVLLGVLVIVLAVFALQQRRTSGHELAAARQQTQNATDALRAAETELTDLKRQHAALVERLQQQAATLASEKAAAEQQLGQARAQLESLEQQLTGARSAAQQLQDRLAALEEEKHKLLADTARLAEQLRAAEQQLAAREKPPPPAVAPEPQPGVAPPAAAPQQPAPRKRRRAEPVTAGNRGLLYHSGRWYTVMPPPQPAQR